MALAKIAKINIISSKKHQYEIIDVLQNLGFVQIDDCIYQETEQVKLEEEQSKLDYQIAGIKFALDYLANFDTSKKTIAQKINSKIEITLDQVKKIIDDFDYEKAVKDVEDLESKINETKNRIDSNITELNQLLPWQQLSFVPNVEKFLASYSFKLVEVNTASYPDLVNILQSKLKLTEIEQISSKTKDIKATIIYRRNDENKLTEILNSLNIKTIDLPKLDTTIDARIAELKTNIKALQNNLRELEKKANKFSLHQNNLKVAFDYLTWQKERLIGQSKIGYSWQTFVLFGWIDESLIKLLKKELTKITNNFIVEELPIKEEESVPVIFKNTWAKPFESVTGIYGAPLSNEPDPTPFLAPFFVIFFGLALTDAGYGIFLAVCTLLAIKIFKIPKESQKLFKVLFWGGVSAFIIGALTGGWFSLDLNMLPSVFKKSLQTIQLINPLENPLSIFYLALALGVVQVIFGLAVNTWWKIKTGQAKEAILTSGLWILTLISLIVFAFSSMGFLPIFLVPIFKWITLGLVAALILGKAFLAKNFFVGIPLGLLGLYNIVGYFSDVLSYSRLLALGLTTGIIGMVVNIMASLVMGIPYVGWLAGAVIFVGGHIFNLGINALGAFIHSGRLQYIEFFPKFMEGGGVTFQPLSRESKYLRVLNN